MRNIKLGWVTLTMLVICAFALGVGTSWLLVQEVRTATQPSMPSEAALPTSERYTTLASKEGYLSAREGGSTTSFSIPEGRKVIYEGYVRLRVSEGYVERVAGELAEVARKLGGYVGEVSVMEDGGYVVLKVPSERFDEALEEVKKIGTVIEARASARDVTEEYIDLKARLNASLALEQRLLQMLQQAKNVEEMLKVEEYLWRVRAQIEVYTAQLKNLERMIQYSTIYVYIEAPAKEVKPIVRFPSFDPLPAVANALSLLYLVIYAIITALIGLSPLALIGTAGYFSYRRLKKRRSAEK